MTLKTRFKEWFASLFYMREGYVGDVYRRGKVIIAFSRERRSAALALAESLSQDGHGVVVSAVFSGNGPDIIIYDSRRDA